MVVRPLEREPIPRTGPWPHVLTPPILDAGKGARRSSGERSQVREPATPNTLTAHLGIQGEGFVEKHLLIVGDDDSVGSGHAIEIFEEEVTICSDVG